MEQYLIPLVVAGVVLMVSWLASERFIPTGETQRKKSLLGTIIEENKSEKDSKSYEEDLKLLKDVQGATGLARLPFISNLSHLLIKSGLWEERSKFAMAAFAIFAVITFLCRKIGIAAFIPGLVVSYLVLNFYLKRKINKRNEKMLDMFPDAIDLIIRSVRSGHPINTAMRMIADNMESPVCDEFKIVVDEVAYGRTLVEALRRMAARLALPDVDFFVVVLAVQQETGGSLTEVLTNLSNIIRKRKQLRMKIRAMTSEGRATSYILGAIPVVEFCGLYFMTPTYLTPLFDTMTGWIVDGIIISLIVMSQIVIRAMINIEI